MQPVHSLNTTKPQAPPLPSRSSQSAEDDSAAAEERDRFFKDFCYIVKNALRLDTVKPGVYRAVQLWTPVAQRTVYGGQLIAHVVEAAYRTVDETKMFIHSLRISFITAGKSQADGCPIEYLVEPLREGRSFCLRQVRAVQAGRTLLTAVAGFHKSEEAGIKHELALPYFVKPLPADRTVSAAFEARLTELLRGGAPRQLSTDAPGGRGGVVAAGPAAASIEYLNLAAAGTPAGVVKKSLAEDVWVKLGPAALAMLAAESAIPLSRLHLIIACWVSDFIVALASLMPHGLPNPDLRMIASLDHAIYFHNPQRVNVADWFVYEVRSSWAGNNRGLNHGRMYGRDGRLWMSVAQETVIRMRKGYVSKL